MLVIYYFGTTGLFRKNSKREYFPLWGKVVPEFQTFFWGGGGRVIFDIEMKGKSLKLMSFASLGNLKGRQLESVLAYYLIAHKHHQKC